MLLCCLLTQYNAGAQATTPTFGSPGLASSAFGGGQRGGSRVSAYTPTTDVDGTSGGSQPPGKLESISAMQVYKDKSHEELRWEDYQLGDKGAPLMRKLLKSLYNSLFLNMIILCNLQVDQVLLVSLLEQLALALQTPSQTHLVRHPHLISLLAIHLLQRQLPTPLLQSLLQLLVVLRLVLLPLLHLVLQALELRLLRTLLVQRHHR